MGVGYGVMGFGGGVCYEGVLGGFLVCVEFEFGFEFGLVFGDVFLYVF